MHRCTLNDDPGLKIEISNYFVQTRTGGFLPEHPDYKYFIFIPSTSDSPGMQAAHINFMRDNGAITSVAKWRY